MDGNGGQLAAEALKRHGVSVIYTLSGGHIFPLYDGAVQRDISLVDVRHEQTAGFAAEGHAKLTREVGVASVTAGPGVTNCVSPLASAHFNGSPVLVIAGRAPQARWGAGSLQEIDHIPIVSSVTKQSRTVFEASEVAVAVTEGIASASEAHRGPVFLDVPLDTMFLPGVGDVPDPSKQAVVSADPGSVADVARRIAASTHPVIVAGSDVWWGGAWDALRYLAETASIPVITNGMGRGCLPADHGLSFSRARSLAFREADLVLVIGTPLDFRLGFGVFGAAEVIHIQDHPDEVSNHAAIAVGVSGDLASSLTAVADSPGAAGSRPDWISTLREEENSKRSAELEFLNSQAEPIHPAAIYGVLREKLDRDAIVICDGGDFVSYAGKYVDSYTPGCWMDPGPYGCLGTGLGYAIAARTVHPDRQIVMMMGDGALGFSAMDFDSLVRHKLPVVAIVGNNGIWGLEKHPMQMLYGYDVAAELRQETRYDDVVTALGGAGETISKIADLAASLDRAFASGVPYLINVLTDPTIAYPRSSNLA